MKELGLPVFSLKNRQAGWEPNREWVDIKLEWALYIKPT